jgi:hypothetical protein
MKPKTINIHTVYNWEFEVNAEGGLILTVSCDKHTIIFHMAGSHFFGYFPRKLWAAFRKWMEDRTAQINRCNANMKGE